MSGKKAHKSRKQFRGCLTLDDHGANPLVRKGRRAAGWLRQAVPQPGRKRRTRLAGLGQTLTFPPVRRRQPPKSSAVHNPPPFAGKARRRRKTGPDAAVGPPPILPRRKGRHRADAWLGGPPPHKARHLRRKTALLQPPPAGLGRRRALAANMGTRLNLSASARAAFALAAEARTTFYLGAGVSVQANIPFFQGEDLTLNFTLTPLTDVTGWTLVSTVKDKLGGTVQFNPAVTITDAGRGKFQAVWTRTQTGALAPGDYVWDVRRTDAGNNTVLAHGEATCRQPVTP
jgi:hypothetical protein